MTPLTPEEQRIVEWLRDGGTTKGWSRATLGLRLRAAFNAFRAPWALPRAGVKDAANAILRGEHRQQEKE